MSEFKNKSITTKGLELLSKGLSGEKIEFTRIEMGGGKFEGDIGEAEALVDLKQNLSITKISRKGSQVTLSTALKIEDITTDFDWTEIGVYARGNDGAEILYLYGYTTNSSYISKDSLNEKLINITLMVSSVSEVTALIDDSLVYLTAEALTDHDMDQDAHIDIRQQLEEVKNSLESIDISWEGITDKPQHFSPSPHQHSWNDIHDRPTSLPASGGNADTVGGRSFIWQGQSGQPQWIWGANEPGNQCYVWNPSNFNVNSANYVQGRNLCSEVDQLRAQTNRASMPCVHSYKVSFPGANNNMDYHEVLRVSGSGVFRGISMNYADPSYQLVRISIDGVVKEYAGYEQIFIQLHTPTSISGYSPFNNANCLATFTSELVVWVRNLKNWTSVSERGPSGEIAYERFL